MSKGLTPLTANADDLGDVVAYMFRIDCPQCGGDLVHTTSGTSTGLRAAAIAQCRRCRMEYGIAAVIEFARPIPGKGRGPAPAALTHTNYSKGRRRW